MFHVEDLVIVQLDLRGSHEPGLRHLGLEEGCDLLSCCHVYKITVHPAGAGRTGCKTRSAVKGYALTVSWPVLDRSHGRREGVIVSSGTEEIKAAAEELTSAMARLVRAIDAVGDDDAAGDISPELLDQLERLTSRPDAAQTFKG